MDFEVEREERPNPLARSTHKGWCVLLAAGFGKLIVQNSVAPLAGGRVNGLKWGSKETLRVLSSWWFPPFPVSRAFSLLFWGRSPCRSVPAPGAKFVCSGRIRRASFLQSGFGSFLECLLGGPTGSRHARLRGGSSLTVVCHAATHDAFHSPGDFLFYFRDDPTV